MYSVCACAWKVMGGKAELGSSSQPGPLQNLEKHFLKGFSLHWLRVQYCSETNSVPYWLWRWRVGVPPWHLGHLGKRKLRVSPTHKLKLKVSAINVRPPPRIPCSSPLWVHSAPILLRTYEKRTVVYLSGLQTFLEHTCYICKYFLTNKIWTSGTWYNWIHYKTYIKSKIKSHTFVKEQKLTFNFSAILPLPSFPPLEYKYPHFRNHCFSISEAAWRVLNVWLWHTNFLGLSFVVCKIIIRFFMLLP